jgi:hypothetical protein
MDIEQTANTDQTQLQTEEIGIEKRIKIVSKLVEFATYSNVGLFDNKRAPLALKSDGTEQKPKDQSSDTKRRAEKKNDLDAQALFNLEYSYRLFDAIEEFSGADVDEYVDRATEKRFCGVFKVVRLEGEQCVLAEIVGLKRKVYYILVEKELLSFIPGDFFQVGHVYFVNDLVINYARKERLIVFLIDQQTKSKAIFLREF